MGQVTLPVTLQVSQLRDAREPEPTVPGPPGTRSDKPDVPPYSLYEIRASSPSLAALAGVHVGMQRFLTRYGESELPERATARDSPADVMVHVAAENGAESTSAGSQPSSVNLVVADVQLEEALKLLRKLQRDVRTLQVCPPPPRGATALSYVP